MCNNNGFFGGKQLLVDYHRHPADLLLRQRMRLQLRRSRPGSGPNCC
jgi:hypothetical protein